eukprot:2785781-Pleurochrysis_carterae.AAC.1
MQAQRSSSDRRAAPPTTQVSDIIYSMNPGSIVADAINRESSFIQASGVVRRDSATQHGGTRESAGRRIAGRTVSGSEQLWRRSSMARALPRVVASRKRTTSLDGGIHREHPVLQCAAPACHSRMLCSCVCAASCRASTLDWADIYCTTSFAAVYLKTQGIPASNHPVREELVRHLGAAHCNVKLCCVRVSYVSGLA